MMRRCLLGIICLLTVASIALAQSVGGGTSPDVSNLALKSDLNGLARGMYASICSVNVNSSTPTSVFCPIGTDSTSVSKRTYAANSLTVGRVFRLTGGGTYTVPTGNTLSADIVIKVGNSSVMSVTTPAAPVGTNAGVDFHADCTVRTSSGSSGTISCQGMFTFTVVGVTSVPVPLSTTPQSFDPSVSNLVDVLGDWNGTTSTHNTVVTQAVLEAVN